MQVAPLNVYLLVKDEFDKRRRSIEDFVFQSFDAFSTTTTTNSYSNDNDEDSVNNNNNKKTSPSRLYTYTAFFESLRTISVDGILGQSYHVESNPYIPGYINADDSFVQEDSNMAFYLSQDDTDDDTDTVASNNAIKYAIVNVCAFLANAMAEAIQFDACEELNGIAFDTSSSSSSSSSGGLLSELSGVNGRYVVNIILNLKWVHHYLYILDLILNKAVTKLRTELNVIIIQVLSHEQCVWSIWQTLQRGWMLF